MGGRRRHTERTFHRGYSSVAGTEQAVRKLREKGEHVLAAAKVALRQGADAIVDEMKSRCPVRTGKLRDSIKAVQLDNGAAYEFSADAQNSNGIAYGQFVEFSPQFATPFFYPSMDARRDEVQENIKQAIQNAVRQGG